MKKKILKFLCIFVMMAFFLLGGYFVLKRIFVDGLFMLWFREGEFHVSLPQPIKYQYLGELPCYSYVEVFTFSEKDSSVIEEKLLQSSKTNSFFSCQGGSSEKLEELMNENHSYLILERSDSIRALLYHKETHQLYYLYRDYGVMKNEKEC